ncbi:hypothetical protein PG999_011306 [Apiospora kogelbergensis]|uniref:Ubiquitin-related modifier 1 n=1 Tax=Apiospora kogelbergensis TaxID=1337665 RepID=A0AAW0QK72_9PEZI
MAKNDPVYDIILVGATGYTGMLTAEHITQFLPTNIRWAIEGRSKGKLDRLATRLGRLSPDRTQPVAETVGISEDIALAQLVGKSKVCISVVSYWQVGEKVVEACIESGTDYVDATGDIYRLKGWIDKYQEQAMADGVTFIHACAAFTAPHDILTLLLVRELRSTASVQTRKVIISVVDLPKKPSGGTVESIIHGATYSRDTVVELQNPWILSPVAGTTTGSTEEDDQTDIFGMRSESGLGLLTDTSYSATQDRHIVHRTWGLLSDSDWGYGSRFRYREYSHAGSRISGIVKLLDVLLATFMLLFALFRTLAKRFVFPASFPFVDVVTESHDVLSDASGGLEMLFSDQRRHSLSIPVATAEGKPATVASLIDHLCRNTMKDTRKELFVLDDHL